MGDNDLYNKDYFMNNLSIFPEILSSLMFERELTPTQVAKAIGVDVTCITRYLRDKRKPSVECLVKLADLFQCSTDFLLGRELENHPTVFYPCPPFSTQLKVLQKHFQCTWCHFYKTAHISSSRFYEWKNGKRAPSLDCVIMLADGFESTVDFILGRTKN